MIDYMMADYNGNALHRILPMGKRLLADDLITFESPNSLNTSKHVVIVMDALKEFSKEPLQWALDNIISTAGYRITLLGVMPWLNIPLSCKTWLDVWSLDIEDISILKEWSEWKSDVKYQKVRAIVELCEKYGVVPYMKVAQGNPLRLLVVERTTNLHATWVVFDRHHRKNRSYYAKTIPCNMVMMNSHGEVDMLRVRSMINNGLNTPGESPISILPIPKVIYSADLKELLKAKREEKSEKAD